MKNLEGSPSFEAWRNSGLRSYKFNTYFEVYDTLFGRFRGKRITFVEIGVGNGGSLQMWRTFFGEEATVIGVDMNPEARKFEENGVRILIGDQADEAFWESFAKDVGQVDIILDDGGHTYEQQIITVECSIDLVKDGGVLVVEDTHSSYHDGYGNRSYSFINYVKHLIDRINYRCENVAPERADRRIWSVHIYESFVAFHVNRAAVSLASRAVHNGGSDAGVEDYRHFNFRSVWCIEQFVKAKLPFFASLPGASTIRRKLVKMATLLSRRDKRLRRFFK